MGVRQKRRSQRPQAAAGRLLSSTKWQVQTPEPPAPNALPRRFGVSQREKLARNVGHPVHTLLMTATPIPRTLALAQYGSLVLSSINEMPPGRRAIETCVAEDTAEGREEARRGSMG